MLIFVGGGGQWWAWRTTTVKTSKCVLIFKGGGIWWCWRRTANENEHICSVSWVVEDSGPGQRAWTTTTATENERVCLFSRVVDVGGAKVSARVQPPPSRTSVFARS